MSDHQKLLDALEAVLMFHAAEPWTDEKAEHWKALTGSAEATTKTLCDFVRKVRDSALGGG